MRWLAGASVMAMVFGGGTALAKPLIGGSGVAATTAAINAASQASQQAQEIAKQSQSALSRAVQAMQAVQAAARAAAAASGRSTSLPQVSVPNGLGAGGLQVAPGGTWQGANAPTQSVSNGRANVGIQQTAPQAILEWNSFNVGAQTTLTFDQQGNANWVALNRVIGNTGPSQILGNISAPRPGLRHQPERHHLRPVRRR